MKNIGSILLFGMVAGCPEAPDPAWKEHVVTELPTVVSGESESAPSSEQTAHQRNPGPMRIAIRPSRVTRHLARTIQRIDESPIDLLVPGSTGTWLESAQREGMPSASSHDDDAIADLLIQALISGRVDCVSLSADRLLKLAADPEQSGRGLVVVASVGSERDRDGLAPSAPDQTWEILSCHPSLISDENMQRDLQNLLVSFMKGATKVDEDQPANLYAQGPVSVDLMDDVLKHLQTGEQAHLSKVKIVDLEAWSKTGVILPATGFPQIMVDNRLLATSADGTDRDNKESGKKKDKPLQNADGSERKKPNNKTKSKNKDKGLQLSTPNPSNKDDQQKDVLQ